MHRHEQRMKQSPNRLIIKKQLYHNCRFWNCFVPANGRFPNTLIIMMLFDQRNSKLPNNLIRIFAWRNLRLRLE